MIYNEENLIYNSIPNSDAMNGLLKIIQIAGKKQNNMQDLKERLTEIQEGKIELDVLDTGNSDLFTFFYKDFIFTAENENVFLHSAKFRKLIVFLLQRINWNCWYGTEITTSSFIIQYQELVNAGLYSTIRSAKRAMEEITPFLEGLIFGKIEKPSRLFNSVSIDRGYTIIEVNPIASWAYIMKNYLPLPSYAYILSETAFDLLLYLLSQARINLKNYNNGYFKHTITMSYIAKALGYSIEREKENNNTSRLVKTIKSAIEEIAEAHKKHTGNTDLTVYLADENKNAIPLKRNISPSNFFSLSVGITLHGQALQELLEKANSNKKKTN